MSAKKYAVTLTPEQRESIESVARSYKHSERERRRARILLLADTSQATGGITDEAIRTQVPVCQATVEQIRRRFAQDGLDAALFRKVQTQRKARVLDGRAEAFLIATVCSAPPDGQARWSLHLLQDQVVQAGYCESVSHETVRQTLKKTNLNPG